MNLISLINQHAAATAESGDWAAVASTLNAATVPCVSHELRNTSWVMLTFTDVVNQQTGMTEADVILGTLQQSTIPRVRAAYDRMSAAGIDLSETQVQEMLPILASAANWPTGLAARVAAFGIWSLSPAENSGLSAVTALQCQQAWQTDRLAARIVNATALANERIAIADTPEQQAAKWGQAWTDAGV